MLGEKKASQVGNDERGITKLIKDLQMLNPELIVVEATGGYQRAVVLGPVSYTHLDVYKRQVRMRTTCITEICKISI